MSTTTVAVQRARVLCAIAELREVLKSASEWPMDDLPKALASKLHRHRAVLRVARDKYRILRFGHQGNQS